MFCTENKQTRAGSQTPRSSMMELFVAMEVISYWQSSSHLDDGEIGELPLYAIIFSFHDKIRSMEEDKDPENSSISHTGTFFSFLGERSIIFCFLCSETVVLWWKHLYSSVSADCYLNQYPYFENIQINCKGVQSPEMFHFETWNLFSHQFWLKKTVFLTTKVEVNKPDLSRIYLRMAHG